MWSASVLVALFIVVAFVGLGGAAVFKYGAADAIKVIVALTAFFGPPLGAIGTYFFTRTEVATAQAQTASAQATATHYKAQLATLTQAKTTLTEVVDSKPASYTLAELKTDPAYKDAVSKLNSGVMVYGLTEFNPKTPKSQ